MKSENTEKYNPSNIAAKDVNFKLMHETYFCSLCRYAARFVQQNAEDIVHDVFEIMWTKRDTICIKGMLSSYLYRSVHNNCLKHMEHIKVVRNHSEHIQSMHKGGELAHEEKNPQFMLIYKEMKKEIDKIMKALPKQQREIMLMRHKLKLSYKEIAGNLDVTEGTVKTQINRAMIKIKNQLKY